LIRRREKINLPFFGNYDISTFIKFTRRGVLFNFFKKEELAYINIQHQTYKSEIAAMRRKRIKTVLLITLYLTAAVITISLFDLKAIKSAYASTIISMDDKLSAIREKYNEEQRIKFLQAKTNDRHIAELIVKYSKKYELDESLLLSLIMIESRINPNAVNYNRNGTIDRGLCQLNSNTFKHLDDEAFFHPETNIKNGAELLAWCLKKAGYDIPTALAIYNAGLGSVINNKVGETTTTYISRVISQRKNIEKEYKKYSSEKKENNILVNL
jgi:soluble lytic murein transglycosylase-like protein